MDRNAMATAVRTYLGQLGCNYVTSTVITESLKDAQKDLNTDSEYNKVDATLSIVGGGWEYALPSTMLDVYSVRLGTATDRVRLTPTDRVALDREYGDWEGSTSGTPTQYWTDGAYIGFYKKPRERAAWTAGTAYSANDIVRASTDNGFFYIASTAGTSTTTEPTWPTTVDGTVGEGDITWTQAGATWVYIRHLQDPTDLANGTSEPDWCPRRFHRTMAKKSAINLASTYGAADEAAGSRYQALYSEYMREAQVLRRLGAHRSREQVARITPTGYRTYRR